VLSLIIAISITVNIVVLCIYAVQRLYITVNYRVYTAYIIIT